MKKITALLSIFILVSCQGEQGPVGPEGPPGPIGKVFEVQGSFGEGNGFSQIFAYPAGVEVLQSDIVAVYLLWEVDTETGNDVWQQLPVSVFFNDGELQYAFDYTVADVKLFLTGDTDLSTVGNEYTQDQIFRIAILPVDFVEGENIDLNNMEEVMGAVTTKNIQRLHL